MVIALVALVVLGLAFFAGMQYGINTAVGGVYDVYDRDVAADVGAVPPVDSGETRGNVNDVPQFEDLFTVRYSDATKGDGSILLIEYSDYECPFCKSFHSTVQALVDSGEVTWVYRHFPLPFHETAEEGARLAECVRQYKGGGAFWTYTDRVFSSDQLSLDVYRGLATDAGLSAGQIDQCLEPDSKAAQAVSAHLTEVQTLGVNGTPGSFLVNTRTGAFERIPGALPLDQVRGLLQSVQ